jgi:hypothetical protein
LARQIRYERDWRGRHATCSYPEPDNIIAAVLYKRLPKHEWLAEEGILYRCTRTHGWVHAVDTRTVSHDTVQTWINVQLEFGAHAWWFNNKARPLRPQLNALEMDMDLRKNDSVTLSHRLKDQGLDLLGDLNLFDLAGRGGPNILLEDKIPEVRRTNETINGINFNKLTRPVQTPLGYFLSATQAAQAQGVKPMYIIYRAGLNHDGCRYISREEYVQWAENNMIKVVIEN